MSSMTPLPLPSSYGGTAAADSQEMFQTTEDSIFAARARM